MHPDTSEGATRPRRRPWVVPVIVGVAAVLVAGSVAAVAYVNVGKESTHTADAPPSAAGTPSPTPSGPPEPTEPITLTVQVFGDPGYDGLVERYMNEHPKITVKLVKTQDLASYTKRVASGKLTGDVIALEMYAMGAEMSRPSRWTDLTTYLGDQSAAYLPWAMRAGATPDGRRQIALPANTGGMAVCYRRDLMEKAGLPADRDALAAKWQTWDDFIAVGKQYRAKMRRGMLDTSSVAFRVIGPQLGGTQFYDDKNKLVAGKSRAVKKAWDTSVALVQQGVTARLAMWSQEWTDGFAKGTFAAVLCPRWMLGIIEGNAGGRGEWDVAALPGGGGTWGGSWLGVPTRSKNRDHAAALALFLTNAQSQAAAAEAGDMVPTRVDAIDSLSPKPGPEYFHGAPVFSLMGGSASLLKPFTLGPKYEHVAGGAFEPWLNAVQAGDASPSEAWSGALAEARNVG